MKRALFFILIFSFVLFSCKNRTTNIEEKTAPDIADSRGYIVKVGDETPDFEIEYLDGRREMLSSHRGKLIMLQFTASWCGVCRKEMPFIEEKIWKRHSGNPNFLLLGIDFKESKEITEKFAKDLNISYPLTLDLNGEKFQLFCGPDAGVTRNIIIDPQGKIIMLTRLFEEEEFNSMVGLIDQELEKISAK